MYLSLLCSTAMMSIIFFFLMIRRPPRSTLDRSSAASDVYKRQLSGSMIKFSVTTAFNEKSLSQISFEINEPCSVTPVSYTHLRAHETVLDLVCRLLLEKKKYSKNIVSTHQNHNAHYNDTMTLASFHIASIRT